MTDCTRCNLEHVFKRETCWQNFKGNAMTIVQPEVPYSLRYTRSNYRKLIRKLRIIAACVFSCVITSAFFAIVAWEWQNQRNDARLARERSKFYEFLAAYEQAQILPLYRYFRNPASTTTQKMALEAIVQRPDPRYEPAVLGWFVSDHLMPPIDAELDCAFLRMRGLALLALASIDEPDGIDLLIGLAGRVPAAFALPGIGEPTCDCDLLKDGEDSWDYLQERAIAALAFSQRSEAEDTLAKIYDDYFSERNYKKGLQPDSPVDRGLREAVINREWRPFAKNSHIGHHQALTILLHLQKNTPMPTRWR